MSFFLGRYSSAFRPLSIPVFRGSRQILRPGLSRPYSHYSSYGSGGAAKVVWGLIGANTAVFAVYKYAEPATRTSTGPFATTTHYPLYRKILNNFLISLDSVEAGKWWTIVTSTFFHMDLWHFLGNMFSMYAFGTILARHPGIRAIHVATLALGSGVFGSFGFLLHQYRRRQPNVKTFGLGASGAVMGMGAAAACLFPKHSVLLYGIIPVPLWLLIGGYFAFDSYYLDKPGTKVAHAGHLGGLCFGLVYYFLRLRRFGGVASIMRRSQ
ncbi:rhomboid-domain-containing protein [Glonium stellatum]|uniref:Rhomboid-domain-containing protein n=1 Tax=Glonium stellatum TaxID=574774 RepID=A0A8E2EPN9_9PEZI|nr:rhomboid-domain-containing protein [Glonium stellatum]